MGNSGTVETASRLREDRSSITASGTEAVLQLAEDLPTLEDVREVSEHDSSDLTSTEQGQLQRTEEVIDAALAAGDAAVWVIAQALERAARGRWWRVTHPSLSAYAEEKVGRSAVYARQLRMNAPLALETARRTGTVPKPSQMKATRKTEQQHGLDAAVTLYEVVRDVTAELGSRTTAESLAAVHAILPERLPEQDDARRAAIEQAARRALTPQTSSTGCVPEPPQPERRMHRLIRPPEREGSVFTTAEASVIEQKSNKSASIEAPVFELNTNNSSATPLPTTSQAAPVPHLRTSPSPQDAPTREHLHILEEALAALAAVDESLTADIYTHAAADPQQASDYERLRQHIIVRAAAIRARALRAARP